MSKCASPETSDYEAWADLRLRSREFLAPWEPIWPSNDLTRAAFRSRIKRYWRDIEDDTAYPFFIFSAGERQLVGALTLSNVRRGVAQTASLGYWIGAPYARRGLMTSAVGLAMGFRLRSPAASPARGGLPAQQHGVDCAARAAAASNRKDWRGAISRSQAVGRTIFSSHDSPIADATAFTAASRLALAAMAGVARRQ